MKQSRLFSRTAGAAMAAVVLSGLLAACGGSSGGGSGTTAAPGGGTGPASSPAALPGKGKPAIVMGDKNFAEEYLLGALYSQALKAKGFTVTLKENLGSSEIADKSLTSGQIDIYPEYTGVIYTELAKLGDRGKSADSTYAGAKSFEAKRGFTILEPTPFRDADGVAVLNDYAKKNGLKTIGDLSKVGSFTYAGPPENGTRFQGVVGLKKVYKLNKIQFKPLTIGAQYQALNQKKVDSIAIFTTDGQLASGKYAVLEDTEGIFGFQQAVPVVSDKVLKAQGPAFAETLNAVSAKLTTDAIVAMNKAVQIDQKKPADVAKAFLAANGLS